MNRQKTLGTFIEERRTDGDIVDKTKKKNKHWTTSNCTSRVFIKFFKAD